MKLVFLGDCMFGRLVNDVLERATPQYPWGDTLPILQQADWRLCNLECVISDRGRPWSEYSKTFHFRSATKNIAVLHAAQLNAVSLANNHVLDFGYDALLDMLDVLDRTGIAHAGAGANITQASQIVTTDVQGRRIGLLAFTDNEPLWEASPEQPGIFYVPVDPQDLRALHLLETIRDHRQAVDLLIVSAHWGSNWGYVPPDEHIAFAHALVQAGADIVFGHSSHVFRGIEFYQGRPILYGAGDFIDDYAVDQIERNDQSFIYLIEFENKNLRRLWLYPTLIRTCRASLARQIHAQRIAEKMRDLCAALNTSAQWDPAHEVLQIECPLTCENAAANQRH